MKNTRVEACGKLFLGPCRREKEGTTHPWLQGTPQEGQREWRGWGALLPQCWGWGVGVGCSHLAAKTLLHNPPPLPCPSQAPEALIPPDLHSGRIPASVSHPALHFWPFLNPGPRPVSQTLPSPVPFADNPAFIPNPIEGRREE